MDSNSKLLIDEKPILVLPSMAVLVGLNEAIIQQKVHFWLKVDEQSRDERKFKDGRWWVYNSYGEWRANFPWWHEDTIARIVRKLEKDGLLISRKVDASKWVHTKWYTIDYVALNCAYDDCKLQSSMNTASCSDPLPQVAVISLTETTPETTPETTLILSAWRELFPNKSQPKTPLVKSYHNHLLARLQNPDFVAKWRQALERAARCKTLQAEGWFTFLFFIRNDENYQKMLDGWMEWKDRESNNGRKPPVLPQVDGKARRAAAVAEIERQRAELRKAGK